MFAMRNIAVITGASSGIGREFAVQVARKYNFDEIWIVARRADRLRALADELNCPESTCVVRPVAMDISGKDGVARFCDFIRNEAERTSDDGGRGLEIGLLVNNAGFGTYGPFAQTSLKCQMEMIELNCTTVTGICGIALPYLKEGSVIINTASLAAFMPLGNFAVYAASKSYVLNFSLALAAELKDRGIKVCALCPGSVLSEFADVASNGARKEVKGGFPPQKVVAHCLERAFRGKKTALYRAKWRLAALTSRFAGRYFCARVTFRHHKRPRAPDSDMS